MNTFIFSITLLASVVAVSEFATAENKPVAPKEKPKTEICIATLGGRKAIGTMQLEGAKTMVHLTDGSLITLETEKDKEQCEENCTLKKSLSIYIDGQTFKAKSIVHYRKNSGGGYLEFPIVSGFIQGQELNAYCKLNDNEFATSKDETTK